MALETTITGSAERLQARRDQQYALLREQRAQAAVRQARDADLQRQTRDRVEQIGREVDGARFQRELVRDAADDRLLRESRALARLEDQADNQVVRRNADADATRADAQAAAREFASEQRARPPLTETATTPQPAETTPGADPYRQLLAERGARRTERDAQQQQFAIRQQQDLARAERSIARFRDDPGSFPETVARGGIVDVQA